MSSIYNKKNPEEDAKEGLSKELSGDTVDLPKDLSPHSDMLTLEKSPCLLKPIFLCVCISFGGFMFGWDVGTIGGITNMQSFQAYFGTITDPVTGLKRFPDLIIGLLISIFNIGCAIGGLTLAKLGDFKGRKLGIIAAIAVYWVGLQLQVINHQKWLQFFFGRVVTGLAVGSTAVLIPMFISESAPTKIRGSMVVLYQLMVTLGILAGNIINYICLKSFSSQPNDNRQWQVPLLLGFAWSVIILVGLSFTPESAQYLMLKRNDVQKAKRSFSLMNGIDEEDEKTYEFIEESMREKQDMLKMGKQQGIFEFITGKPKLGLRLLIGVLVMTFQQLSGINYFFYYGTTIFERAHLDPYLTPIVLSGVNFGATFVSIYLVEALGRKSCLLLGSVGMFCCMMIYASVGSFALESVSSAGIMTATTCVYIFFFATTLGPVTFVLVSELFPMKTRATSMAICSSFNWLFNFAISLLTPTITSKIGFLYGYFFAGCLFLSALCVWILVPETRNKTEADINRIYECTNSE